MPRNQIPANRAIRFQAGQRSSPLPFVQTVPAHTPLDAFLTKHSPVCFVLVFSALAGRKDKFHSILVLLKSLIRKGGSPAQARPTRQVRPSSFMTLWMTLWFKAILRLCCCEVKQRQPLSGYIAVHSALAVILIRMIHPAESCTERLSE